MTEETAEHYADRVLAYCMKKPEKVAYNDPELRPKTKPVEQPKSDPVDAVFAAFDKKQVASKIQTVDEYKSHVLKEMFE